MFISIFFNVVFLVVLLYFIKELSKELKLFNKHFILIVASLLIINVFVTYNYVQIKSSHNTATFRLYDRTTDSIRQVGTLIFEETENMEDIVVLNQVIEDIIKHTHPLLMQLNHTRLFSRRQHQQMYTIILEELTEQLSIFLRHHNRIIARGEKIDEDKFEQYDQLSLKLYDFAQSDSISSSGVRFGVTQHKISLEDSRISRLQKIVDDISEIVADLTSEN